MLSTRDPEAGAAIPLATAYHPAPPSHVQALQSNLTLSYFESEERFRQIVEGLHDIVALANVSGTQVYFVNAAYEQIWGQSRDKLYDDPMAFLECVHPEDRARVRDVMFRQARKEFALEFRVVRPNGDQRWVSSRGFPVRHADGEIYRIASITEDVTERKAIAASHQRLLRGFTHDVKNPLGAADGYLSLLEIGVYGELPAKQLDTISRARRSIRAGLKLVSQLLEIERAEAGELSVDRERVDLGTLASDCVDDFRAAANNKRQVLTFLVSPGDDLVVESDRARVRQILANLVSNAVKYTQSYGTIAISARVADGDDETAPWRGRWVVLAVADTGPGIPPEKHSLLFREFTRFDPGAAEGSGIGLAISQQIARALGAAITFKSTPGIGSTFTLWLPCDPAPVSPK